MARETDLSFENSERSSPNIRREAEFRRHLTTILNLYFSFALYIPASNGPKAVKGRSEYAPDIFSFIRSASLHTGSKESFLAKLDILREAVREGHFAFSPEELDAYLRTYAKAGYPMVSHSDAYRSAYAPAYRIILRGCVNTR